MGSFRYAHNRHRSSDGVGLARFVQDPLNVIATLFDSKKTALQLFSSSFQYSRRDQQEALYAALCWEMSLWVAATGFWIDDCILRPNSLALLQFVPGLGISKATVLHKAINEDRPSDRASLKRLVEEVLSCAVAANATSIIRIPPLSRMGEMMETKWHPLDQTLIPLEEYDVAAYVAAAASRNDKLKHKAFLALNLIEFVTQASEYRRRSVHHEIRDARGVLDAIREKKIPGYTLISGAREVDFISDELVANGLSFMRRPYRRMTTKGLLFHVAGVAFFTKDEVSAKVPSHSHRTDDLVIHEDTYLCGIIEGFRAGRSPGIRITTSRGLRAFMHVNDIDDENVKQEVLERIRHLEASREGGEDSVSLQPYIAPEWLQRGSVIQGTVIRCNWPRCEFLLRWCAPKTVEMREVAEQHFTSYADVIRDGASSANSIRTAQMEADASVFCTKISEHPLFRDVSNVEAMALLRDKDIGEVLFRPSSHGKSKAICMVKIGEAVTCSMVIAEDRRSDGRIYYRFKDTISRETGEFNDVDEFHQKYIIPMVALVQNLRSHRRFVGSIQDIKSSLIAQQQGTQRFAYAFFENTKRNRPPLYRVATRGGGKDHYFPLHISDKFIFVQLPFVSSSSQGRVSNIWVSCINAERVSEVVKQHAARSVPAPFSTRLLVGSFTLSNRLSCIKIILHLLVDDNTHAREAGTVSVEDKQTNCNTQLNTIKKKERSERWCYTFDVSGKRFLIIIYTYTAIVPDFAVCIGRPTTTLTSSHLLFSLFHHFWFQTFMSFIAMHAWSASRLLRKVFKPDADLVCFPKGVGSCCVYRKVVSLEDQEKIHQEWSRVLDKEGEQQVLGSSPDHKVVKNTFLEIYGDKDFTEVKSNQKKEIRRLPGLTWSPTLLKVLDKIVPVLFGGIRPDMGRVVEHSLPGYEMHMEHPTVGSAFLYMNLLSDTVLTFDDESTGRVGQALVPAGAVMHPSEDIHIFTSASGAKRRVETDMRLSIQLWKLHPGLLDCRILQDRLEDSLEVVERKLSDKENKGATDSETEKLRDTKEAIEALKSLKTTSFADVYTGPAGASPASPNADKETRSSFVASSLGGDGLEEPGGGLLGGDWKTNRPSAESLSAEKLMKGVKGDFKVHKGQFAKIQGVLEEMKAMQSKGQPINDMWMKQKITENNTEDAERDAREGYNPDDVEGSWDNVDAKARYYKTKLRSMDYDGTAFLNSRMPDVSQDAPLDMKSTIAKIAPHVRDGEKMLRNMPQS
eukprot:gene10650-7397_t